MKIAQLKDYGDQLLKELKNDSMKHKSSPPANNLYHYTSFNNFLRIIKNQELCFTDYRHLNDPTEISLSETVLHEAIENKYKQSPLGEKFWKPFLEFFSALITEESLNKVRHYLSHLEKYESRIYTFSFCGEKDYLSMWRWYAENGTGISLGFRPGYFFFEQPKDRRPQAIYTDVCYEKEKLLEIINNSLDSTEREIGAFVNFAKTHRISKEDSREAGYKFLNDVRIDLSTLLLPIMPGFKHHSYKDEKEHRLYYLECKAILKDKPNKPYYFPFDPIPQDRRGTRSRKAPEGICLPHINTEVPFVKSDKFSFYDIAEIWVGPCVYFECAREQIVKLLIEKGYDLNKIDTHEGIKIKKSQAPYR
jgi:hypothetical protein